MGRHSFRRRRCARTSREYRLHHATAPARAEASLSFILRTRITGRGRLSGFACLLGVLMSAPHCVFSASCSSDTFCQVREVGVPMGAAFVSAGACVQVSDSHTMGTVRCLPQESSAALQCTSSRFLRERCGARPGLAALATPYRCCRSVDQPCSILSAGRAARAAFV